MINDGTLLRLILSQAFAVTFILLLLPIKAPVRKNMVYVVMSAFLIVLANALFIYYAGLTQYIRYYFLTLTLPYILLGLWFSVYKGAKFIFVILTIQIIGNVSIINGLLASYLVNGQDSPFIDTAIRIITYIAFLPVIIKYIQPTYKTMTVVMKKGWWTLNIALIISYALAYYILFVPTPIFSRPEYFPHAYIGIVLSLFIYFIIFYLFNEIEAKVTVEQDKAVLSTKISSLTKETAVIESIAYKDALTGLNNRYSLYKDMEKYIQDNKTFLIIFIDLNNLKQINDVYGHAVGDLYLQKFAYALKSVVSDQGIVYRFAGDEFICIMPSGDHPFDSQNFKSSIAKFMNLEVPYHDVCLGTAHYPKDGDLLDDLIKLVDRAMYNDKRTYKASSSQ